MARHEKQIVAGRHLGLMVAEHLAEAAFGAVALDGVADGRNGGDDANAHEGTVAAPRKIPEGKRRTLHTPALFPDSTKIARAAQMLLRAEAHGRAAAGENGQSDHRQALAAFETAGFDDFAAALGGHTGTVTNLAGALFAVWAECRLHDF